MKKNKKTPAVSPLAVPICGRQLLQRRRSISVFHRDAAETSPTPVAVVSLNGRCFKAVYLKNSGSCFYLERLMFSSVSLPGISAVPPTLGREDIRREDIKKEDIPRLLSGWKTLGGKLPFISNQPFSRRTSGGGDGVVRQSDRYGRVRQQS